MELVGAVKAASTPVVRAVLLMMAALHGGPEKSKKETWTCCRSDGSPAATFSETEGWKTLRECKGIPPTVEMQFHVDHTNDNAVKFKWVPMDDSHVVLIAQRTETGVSTQPVSISLSTGEEPLLSIMKNVSEWTTETAEDAVKRLRLALFNRLSAEFPSEGNGSSNTTNNNTNTAPPHRESEREVLEERDVVHRESNIAAPDRIPVPAGESLFAGIVPRLPGYRYGERDLLPGGGITPPVGNSNSAGGMFLGPQAFNNVDLPQARYNPMFPGDTGPYRGGRPQPMRTFPGEPDPDLLLPPGGPAFGGLGFGPGRGGRGPSYFG
ncbi:uncharacterized protein TM35_000064040 [Trypanosoma theileri]|uniref:Uncharacterized protein n=1 Tax=Trypanosoma theileri TaxID=67003 RepID=A0A1X0P4B1_9TRYP|nr:uncharacterized protein TM35_000064040 [Trypanosoma theileri]ORC91399.1 hypothetical protein TM35_000064040 [Trypanosoma theileri]